MPGTKSEELERYREEWLQHCDQVWFNTYIPRKLREPVPADQAERCPDQLFFQAEVRWDGRVPLCAYQFGLTEQEWLGDLNRNSLEEIWASKRLNEMRVAHRNRDFAKADFCRSCAYTQCGGRLSANRRRYNTTHNALVISAE
jgi:hypothetical protein